MVLLKYNLSMNSSTPKKKMTPSKSKRILRSITQAARDLWWNKLTEVVNVEKSKEPRSTNIQVTYVDSTNSIEYCKTFAVRAEDTARGCVKLAVSGLEGGGGGDPGGGGWRLWAKTPRDDSPVPLIGHERPFAIKLSCLRDSLSAEEGFDLDHCNNVHDPLAKCHFILRNSFKENGSDNGEKKNGKKVSGRMKFGQVFRRTPNKDEPAGFLFGLPLGKLCHGDKLPSPLVCMLSQVNAKGPFTQGIFRRSANARLVRELREKLDRGEAVAWDQVPVLATAALLKDLLRSLPDPLLSSSLYSHWAAAMEINNLHQRLTALKGVYEKLPKVNQWLLCQFIAVLSNVARRCQDNLMSAANLAVCVGPSLLWSDCPAQDLRLVPSLVETLIHHAPAVMSPPQIPSFDTRDSGTDESDSLKRDDSSIESLECSPPPRKDKISLSRDSGLTMSDSQLYTPDEEESGSTSSSGYDPAFDPHSKVTPSMSVPGEYVRVYGGWEERMNPNFQRQAWFRQRYAAAGRQQAVTCTKPEVTPRHPPPPRRSASEESLLDPPPPTPPRRNKPDLRNKSTTNLHVYSLRSEHRNVVPVTCQVISESRRHQYRESVYSNTPKPILYQQQSTSSPSDNSIYYTPKYSPRLEFTQSLLDTSSDSSLYKTCVENQSKEEDSSTLSDDDCTPHVSRSNSRGNEVKSSLRPHEVKSSSRRITHEIKTGLRHLPPVHVESAYVRPSRPRNPRDSPRLATRSRSLPPPPASVAKRAPITTYYLGDTPYHVTTSYRDEESYV